MWVEKGEVCWSAVDFNAKSQINSTFAGWATKLMAHDVYSEKIISAGIKS